MTNNLKRNMSNDLEGKKVICIGYADGLTPLIISGYDYDIGISITFEDGSEFMCIHGEYSPHRWSYVKSYPKYAEAYPAIFSFITALVKNGEFEYDDMVECFNKNHVRQNRWSDRDPLCAYK